MAVQVAEAEALRRSEGRLRAEMTERKQAEERLRESEARHRAVVDTAPDGIVTVDSRGIIKSFNPGAERIFGYTAEQAVGQTATLLVPEQLKTAYLEGMRRYAELSREPALERTLESIGRRKDGSEFPIELSIAEIREQKGIVFTAIVRDATERKNAQEQLRYQAFHDPLTGLPNRALFQDRVDQALSRAARRYTSVVVLFLDLDRFKVINDSLGHEAGDHLLIGVGERLRRCVHPEDTVARLGGDEFVILVEESAELDRAIRLAEQIREDLRAPFVIAGQEMVVTASVGIAISEPGVESVSELMRKADVAMYRAKAKGKARHEVFDLWMNADTLRRLETENELRHAIEHGELRVHYQPKVELATGRIVGVEALVRWEHTQRGLVPPAEFIPLAEETGLILPLGRWVMEEACRQMKAWHEQCHSDPPLTLSVNLSPSQFQHPTIVEDVAQVLRETGLSAGSLELEITESAAMEDAEGSIAMLGRLKALGLKLGIDDFGTGYSSLSYLKRFPVDTLKIDKSFVGVLGQGAEGTAIVESVITLAHALGLQVTAEGLETAEQLAQLRVLGCELAQGYYFSVPLPAEAAGALLESGHHSEWGPLANDRNIIPFRPGGSRRTHAG